MFERSLSEVATSGAESPDLSRRNLLLAGTVLASMASLGTASPATAAVGVTAEDEVLTTAQVRTRRLFFYNADTGRAAAGRLDNRGRYTNTSDQSGFSTGWTHVVSVV